MHFAGTYVRGTVFVNLARADGEDSTAVLGGVVLDGGTTLVLSIAEVVQETSVIIAVAKGVDKLVDVVDVRARVGTLADDTVWVVFRGIGDDAGGEGSQSEDKDDRLHRCEFSDG